MAKSKYREIHLVIHGGRSLNEIIFAQEFFGMLGETGAEYLPKKIGMYEPIKTPYTLENACQMWMESVKEMGFGCMDFVGNMINGSIRWKNYNLNSISIYISCDFLNSSEKIQKLISLVKKLFSWSNGLYGFVVHPSQSSSMPGLSFETCLWGISWMTLFGLPYVKMFGKNTIETAPCMVEEFSENMFMLLTAPEPREQNQELIDAQLKVKKHLGEDAFWRREPLKT